MPRCNRCGSEIGLLGRLSFNQQAGRCGKCEKEVKQAFDHFRNMFVRFCQDSLLWQWPATG